MVVIRHPRKRRKKENFSDLYRFINVFNVNPSGEQFCTIGGSIKLHATKARFQIATLNKGLGALIRRLLIRPRPNSGILGVLIHYVYAGNSLNLLRYQSLTGRLVWVEIEGVLLKTMDFEHFKRMSPGGTLVGPPDLVETRRRRKVSDDDSLEEEMKNLESENDCSNSFEVPDTVFENEEAPRRRWRSNKFPTSKKMKMNPTVSSSFLRISGHQSSGAPFNCVLWRGSVESWPNNGLNMDGSRSKAQKRLGQRSDVWKNKVNFSSDSKNKENGGDDLFSVRTVWVNFAFVHLHSNSEAIQGCLVIGTGQLFLILLLIPRLEEVHLGGSAFTVVSERQSLWTDSIRQHTDSTSSESAYDYGPVTFRSFTMDFLSRALNISYFELGIRPFLLTLMECVTWRCGYDKVQDNFANPLRGVLILNIEFRKLFLKDQVPDLDEKYPYPGE
ncbi:hypothetical protein Tco_0788506 [Tanacetum coccineum]